MLCEGGNVDCIHVRVNSILREARKGRKQHIQNTYFFNLQGFSNVCYPTSTITIPPQSQLELWVQHRIDTLHATRSYRSQPENQQRTIPHSHSNRSTLRIRATGAIEAAESSQAISDTAISSKTPPTPPPPSRCLPTYIFNNPIYFMLGTQPFTVFSSTMYCNNDVLTLKLLFYEIDIIIIFFTFFFTSVACLVFHSFSIFLFFWIAMLPCRRGEVMIKHGLLWW